MYQCTLDNLRSMPSRQFTEIQIPELQIIVTEQSEVNDNPQSLYH